MLCSAATSDTHILTPVEVDVLHRTLVTSDALIGRIEPQLTLKNIVAFCQQSDSEPKSFILERNILPETRDRARTTEGGAGATGNEEAAAHAPTPAAVASSSNRRFVLARGRKSASSNELRLSSAPEVAGGGSSGPKAILYLRFRVPAAKSS